MIQDIYPHQFHNAYAPDREAKPADPVFFYRRDRLLLLKEGDSWRLPTVSEFPEESLLVYLFSVDDRSYFLYMGSQDDGSFDEDLVYGGKEQEDVPGWENSKADFLRLHFLREEGSIEKWQYFTAITAFHLHQWYSNNKFCGRCGHETVQKSDERALVCPKCGNHIYPRINPAVIIGVTNGDKLLVTRYANRPIAYDALVAGFTEIGETLEENVIREVREEVGLEVTNIRYYKSQPWGVVSDVLMGFYCDVTGDTTVTLDGELASAIWMDRSEIKGQPDDMSLTNEMMMVFRDGKEPK